jgi:hypothetical protein
MISIRNLDTFSHVKVSKGNFLFYTSTPQMIYYLAWCIDDQMSGLETQVKVLILPIYHIRNIALYNDLLW